MEQGGGNQSCFIFFFFYIKLNCFFLQETKKPVIKFLDCGFSMEGETSQGHSSGC